MRFFDIATLLALGLLNIAFFAERASAGSWGFATFTFVVGCACLFQAGRIFERKP